jgi:hypothetical protein
MNGKLAMTGKKGWREILQPHTRSAGNKDYISVGIKTAEYRIALVGNQTGKLHKSTVAFNQRCEHRTIRVRNAVTVRRRSGRQQFVAGDHQPHPRAAVYANLLDANRTEYADVLRPQPPAGLKERRALPNVLSAPADVLAGRHRGKRSYGKRTFRRSALLRFGFNPLGRQNGVAAARQGRSGHDTDSLSCTDLPSKGTSGKGISNHGQRQAIVRSGTLRAFGGECVSIHGGTVEPRHIHAAGDRLSEHSTGCHLQSRGFGVERMQSGIEPCEGGLDRMAFRKTPHPYIVVLCVPVLIVHASMIVTAM